MRYIEFVAVGGLAIAFVCDEGFHLATFPRAAMKPHVHAEQDRPVDIGRFTDVAVVSSRDFMVNMPPWYEINLRR